MIFTAHIVCTDFRMLSEKPDLKVSESYLLLLASPTSRLPPANTWISQALAYFLISQPSFGRDCHINNLQDSISII